MEKLLIRGGKRLCGEVHITGAKNAVLGILPGALLARGVSVIDNVPGIQDCRHYFTMLKKLGCQVDVQGDVVTIDTTQIKKANIKNIWEESTKMRASYYMLGALLSVFGDVVLPLPGGCDIGARPIGLHIKGFEALGAKVVMKGGFIHVHAKELKGAEIYLDFASVGATINILLACVKAKGQTVIENAAKEPHVVDIANFLNKMGAKIKGAGTDTIRVLGVDTLTPTTYSVIPDQISAGTYMIAAAATGGDVRVMNVIPKHMESLSAKLEEMGNEIYEEGDAIRVVGAKKLTAVDIKTLPYPGFPTDLQQPMGVLMSIASGVSSITENIFENRFKYVGELAKMGADILVKGNMAIFTGVNKLYGAKVNVTDLRAGAAMVIAALAAQGESEIFELKHIDRGYENIEENFRALGADIQRVTTTDEDKF